jgi:prepilin-type N-terminal cleavage/methylation domain-containing protein
MIKTTKGFTLVELMVALAVSGFLMAGVSFVYLSLSQSINTTKELENAQEVLRYSSEVFTRSLKQTTESPDNSVSKTLKVKQIQGAIACDGRPRNNDFEETFLIIEDENQLRCIIDAEQPKIILTGIASIDFSVNDNLVTINIKPKTLTDNIDILNSGFDLNIALTGKILTEALD